VLILASISSEIHVVTSAAVTTDVHASWVDDTAGAIIPGALNSLITTATNTIVVTSPGSSYRNVKFMSFANRHATLAQTVTVQHYDGANTVQLVKVTLQPGDTLLYPGEDQWVVLDANGAQKTVQSGIVGRFLKRTVLTTGTSFTTTAATNTLTVRLLGGGGGGGGATSNLANISAAGGGSSGGYAEKTFTVTPSTTYTYQVGAGGAGGINGANAGNQGTNSFFVVGATNTVANGGPGGAAAPAAPAPTMRLGGALPTLSTGGDLNASGKGGGPGSSFNTTVALSGDGGDSMFGGGGGSVNVNGTGAAATSFGSGGAGALTVAAANAVGGAGFQGVLIVDEYA
jgi:hypothetical protein